MPEVKRRGRPPKRTMPVQEPIKDYWLTYTREQKREILARHPVQETPKEEANA